ncbi:TPA: hypothetical protein ACH3X2_010222 [Trebouxia sp. C0005]
MDLGPSTAVPVTRSSKKTQVCMIRHPYGAVPQQLSTEGSAQCVPLNWVPPIERTATPECVLRPHTQDRKAVECWAKPLKPLGRTSKRKAHRLRCSLTQNARSTPNAQRAGTRIAHETGEDQLGSPEFTGQAHGSSPTIISPGSPPGIWHQGHALDLPAMLNTPMAIRRLSHMLDASFQEQEYTMKAESPTPTLSPLDLQCDAYNSRLHGHQLPPCTLSAFILSPPKSLDQTSLDKAQSAAQQPMCKASVQSSEQQLAPRQVHHCTGLDVPAALDDMTDIRDRRRGPTCPTHHCAQMAGASDSSVIVGLPRAADQDAFHLTVLNSMMAHLLMLQTACEVSSIVLMLKYLLSCPMTQALLVETQIVYAVRPFKQV